MSDQMIGLICGVFHLVLSFFLALIATFGSFKIFDKLTRNIDEVSELKANNVAVSIMMGGMLLSSAIIMKTVSRPAISTLQVHLYEGITGLVVLKTLGFLAAYIAGAMVLAITAVWVAVWCFMVLTRRIDELAEIKNNNVAVAIILAVVLVIMGLFLADGINSFLNAVVPFPKLQEIEILTR